MDRGPQSPLTACVREANIYGIEDSCSHSSAASSDIPLKKKYKKEEFISSTVAENVDNLLLTNSISNNDYVSLKNILCSPTIRKHIGMSAENSRPQISKRMKCDENRKDTVNPMILESSTLLDQLMTPLKSHKTILQGRLSQATKILSNQSENVHACSNRLENESISHDVFKNKKPPTQQPDTSCNSVLKNLLVSGCDMSAGYTLAPIRPRKMAKV